MSVINNILVSSGEHLQDINALTLCSLLSCLLGTHSGPANWPSASRLVDAICRQLCTLHPKATRVGGITKTRWSLILSDYVAIRDAVLASPRLMAQTEIQLFELNQRTISQW